MKAALPEVGDAELHSGRAPLAGRNLGAPRLRVTAPTMVLSGSNLGAKTLVCTAFCALGNGRKQGGSGVRELLRSFSHGGSHRFESYSAHHLHFCFQQVREGRGSTGEQSADSPTRTIC